MGDEQRAATEPEITMSMRVLNADGTVKRDYGEVSRMKVESEGQGRALLARLARHFEKEEK